ncbi:glycosyltransferase family 2 protein [Patulibacter defluvii]|uniref:glycosyltransferase family 2 protein n=1 Tax=Patulibacter defluvii TaxID=3095358 RepID=UPI002A74F64A|nr:glycosyltransferase family 2 protein [Patulibacter sp. DM4]
MSPQLVVQIVNFRTRSYLERCLDGLLDELAASGIDHRVLVLENGSGDDLADLVAGHGDRVELVLSADNLGFGGGHDLLAAHEDSPFLCCLNPDVAIEQRGVLRPLLAHFDDPAVVAVGPLLRTAEGAPQVWDHGELRGLRARVANGAGHAHWRPRRQPLDVAWVSGAFLLLRRSAFAAVGGFDPRFFLYKEEEDLCLQLRRAGGRIVYDPRVSARHVGGVVARREEHLETSIARYVEKNLPHRRRRWLLEQLYLRVTRRLPSRS